VRAFVKDARVQEPPDEVDHLEIVHGDTARSPFGVGTYGSRSAAVGGAAIAKAVGKIIYKGRKIAGYLLEAIEQDIEVANGKFTVSGPPAARPNRLATFDH
jgi:carbon-monoxide dehydrogenase large subunit